MGLHVRKIVKGLDSLSLALCKSPATADRATAPGPGGLSEPFSISPRDPPITERQRCLADVDNDVNLTQAPSVLRIQLRRTKPRWA